MLTTFDRTKWGEDIEEEKARGGLWMQSTPEEMRKYYPYEGVIKKPCKSYGFNEGDVVAYVRVRHAPQFFPIEGLILEGNVLRHCYFGSEEIQVREV